MEQQRESNRNTKGLGSQFKDKRIYKRKARGTKQNNK